MGKLERMPESDGKGLKRKRSSAHPTIPTTTSSDKVIVHTESDADYDHQVQSLENEAFQSHKHLNNLEVLLSYGRAPTDLHQRQHTAWLSLCRIFARLLAAGKLPSPTTNGSSLIEKWLKQKYGEYVDVLSGAVRTGEDDEANFALSLLMQNVKEEVNNSKPGNEAVWLDGTFAVIVRTLTRAESGGSFGTPLSESM